MTRRHTTLLALLLALLTGFALPVQGQATVTVKMATLVPENSSWFLVLKEVANEWGKISNGKVRVLLYPGGRQGDDPDVVRKMNLGTLNAGVLTSAGLGEIDRGVYALSIPMAFADYEEVYAVLERMRPKLEAQFEAKGFVVLNWADGGWNHWFTKSAAATPEEMKKLKLFSWAGDQKTTEVYKKLGFDARPDLIEQAELIKSITGIDNVRFRTLDFWAMSPAALDGPFAVVLNLGLLYHLAKPVEALAFMGLESSVETTNVAEKGVFYRVRLGPYNKIDDINRVRSQLAQNGIDANLVKVRDARTP